MFIKVKKYLFFFLEFLIFSFIFFFYLSWDESDIQFQNIQFLSETRLENDLFVNGLKIDDCYANYYLKNQSYYFSCNDFNIDNISVVSPYKTKHVLSKKSENMYEIFIYSDKYYQKRSIFFIDVPSLNIYSDIFNFNLDELKISDTYINFNFFDKFNSKSDLTVNDDVNMVMTLFDDQHLKKNFGTFHQRGGTSFEFPKKSFKIDLDNSNTFLSITNDDDWILDALYTDSSKIRNKLSSDFWNLINNNQGINNDLGSNFVEVYINNEYYGLFVLKEKVDKKLVGISKNGLLLKSVYYVDEDDIKKSFSSNYPLKNYFLDKKFEIKYFNEDTYNIFFENMNIFYNNIKSFSNIDSYFDFDNYVNYNIFLCLISGNDNLVKNQYWSMFDSNSKVFITPWDMDLTWGLNWSDDEELRSSFSMESSSDISWLNNNIIKDMDSKTLSLLKQRYWELRKDVITMETINGYLNSYKELLVNSGAAERDSERWYEYDIEFEIEQIREWASRRIAFLDEYFK